MLCLGRVLYVGSVSATISTSEHKVVVVVRSACNNKIYILILAPVQTVTCYINNPEWSTLGHAQEALSKMCARNLEETSQKAVLANLVDLRGSTLTPSSSSSSNNNRKKKVVSSLRPMLAVSGSPTALKLVRETCSDSDVFYHCDFSDPTSQILFNFFLDTHLEVGKLIYIPNPDVLVGNWNSFSFTTCPSRQYYFAPIRYFEVKEVEPPAVIPIPTLPLSSPLSSSLSSPLLSVAVLDIECTFTTSFPDPSKDPVVTVAVVGLLGHDAATPVTTEVFVLGDCNTIPSKTLSTFGNSFSFVSSSSVVPKAFVCSCAKPECEGHASSSQHPQHCPVAERAMLLAVAEHVGKFDVVVGHNLKFFDWIFLQQRAGVLNVLPQFLDLFSFLPPVELDGMSSSSPGFHVFDSISKGAQRTRYAKVCAA